MLHKAYGDSFKIVEIPTAISGFGPSNKFIFEYLKQVDSEYFLQLEEDWVLNRPLDVSEIIKTLRNNSNLIQMRIPRSPWYEQKSFKDIVYGSNINASANKDGVVFKKFENHYEFRHKDYFWSTNPNIFSRKFLDFKWSDPSPHYIDYEYEFGQNLFKSNSNYFCGFWATNVYENYVSHIGVKDDIVLKNSNINSLNFPYNNKSEGGV
jgi:hypothetical protein